MPVRIYPSSLEQKLEAFIQGWILMFQTTKDAKTRANKIIKKRTKPSMNRSLNILSHYMIRTTMSGILNNTAHLRDKWAGTWDLLSTRLQVEPIRPVRWFGVLQISIRVKTMYILFHCKINQIFVCFERLNTQKVEFTE